MIVVTDVCLCEYTSHGHCGVVEDGYVHNDKTLELLAREAVSHAQTGADIIAPSDMMDGRIGAIEKALDANGFSDTPIMAYSAKYSSAFYGHFARRPNRHRNSATAKLTRWTSAIRTRRCARSLSTFRRVPTS